MQMLFHASVCILFAAVSLDEVSDMVTPRGSMGGTYKGEEYRETSGPLPWTGWSGEKAFQRVIGKEGDSRMLEATW